MTATSQITARMAAAQSQRTIHLKDLTSIGRQAKKRHDDIAVGKGNISPEARDAALNGLQSTAAYCDSLVEDQTGSAPSEPERHGTRDHGGKFAKPGSYGHLRRMVQGKD